MEEFMEMDMDRDRETTVVAERARKSIETYPFNFEGQAFSLTVSIGVAGLTEDLKDANDLLSKADTALYDAKHNGATESVPLDMGARATSLALSSMSPCLPAGREGASMREYAFDLVPPRPALNIVMWGRCGLPLANPHMPHTQPLAAEPRTGFGQARGSLQT